MVTMKEVARIANVSQQAVSAALGSATHSRVSSETRAKILRIAKELHYVPNAASRILNGGKSHLIGFFCPEPYFGVAPDIVREFSGQMRQAGYDLLNTGGLHKKNNEEIRQDLRIMESRGLEAVAILDKISGLQPDFFHVPHILMQTMDSFDVDIDLACGLRLAAEHLIAHGRRRIAYLATFAEALPRRVQILQPVMEENNVFDPALYLSVRQFDGDDAALIRELVRLKADGIIAHNDYIASQLIRRLTDSGIRVPEDIAVIGFDGQSFCDVCRVPLATVVQPARQLAQRAAELFLERIERGILHAQPTGILLKPVLRPSASCGCPVPSCAPLDPVNSYRLLNARDGFAI